MAAMLFAWTQFCTFDVKIVGCYIGGGVLNPTSETYVGRTITEVLKDGWIPLRAPVWGEDETVTWWFYKA